MAKKKPTKLPAFVVKGEEVTHSILGVGSIVSVNRQHVIAKFRGRDSMFAIEDVRAGLLRPRSREHVGVIPQPRAPVALPDLSQMTHERRERLLQLLQAFVHNPLGARTTVELQQLMGRPVMRNEAQNLAAEIKRRSKDVPYRAPMKANPVTVRVTAAAIQPTRRLEPSTQTRTSPLETLVAQLAASRVRHGCNTDIARELLSRRLTRQITNSFETLGPLKLANYQVGSNSPSVRTRREILEDFVCYFPIPNTIYESDYCERWGIPGSIKRKERTEQALRRFISLHGAREGQESAVDDWQSDLDWLRSHRLRGGQLAPTRPPKRG